MIEVITPELYAQAQSDSLRRLGESLDYPTSEATLERHYLGSWLAMQAAFELSEETRDNVVPDANSLYVYAAMALTGTKRADDGRVRKDLETSCHLVVRDIRKYNERIVQFSTDEHYRQFLLERLARLMNHNLSGVQGLGTEGEQ